MADTVFRVSAPGSTANLGPGFDVLGLAIALRAEVGSGPAPVDAHLLDEHHPATIAHRRAGGSATSLWSRSRLPMGRGLGYSGAVRAAGAMLAFVEANGPQAAHDEEFRASAFEVAAELEGHPDNAAASVFGGLVIASPPSQVTQVPIGCDASIAVWIPDTTTSTDHSRTQLAPTIERADAVANIAAVANLIVGWMTGDPMALRAGCSDRLHQPTRLAAVPASAAALNAMLEHGALSAWLSGSGPTVAALASRSSADEIVASLDGGTVRVLDIDTTGVAVDIDL